MRPADNQILSQDTMIKSTVLSQEKDHTFGVPLSAVMQSSRDCFVNMSETANTYQRR